MRRMILLAGLVLAVAVFLPGSARPAFGGSDLPFKGWGSGTVTVNLATGQGHIVSTSQLSHLGLSLCEQDVRVVPTGPNTLAEFFTGTITAANGDRIFVSGVGSETVGTGHGTISATYVSTGGTGRFADARLTFAVTVDTTLVSAVNGIVNGTFVATFDGQLSW